MTDEEEDDGAFTLEPGHRLFGVDDADHLVPHLTVTFERLRELRAEIAELLETLSPHGIVPGQPLPPDLAIHPDVAEPLAAVVERDSEVRELLTELQETGVDVKSLDGLVDVLSRFHGRVVYLCWQRGEGAFTHWHELDGGFAGRQPILDRAAFRGSLLA